MNAPVPVNAMSVDVEDYFQVSAFENTVAREDWDGIAPRVEANTRRILDLFDEHGASATFFTLGWVAERFPALVREIVTRGHEVASHGHSHVRANHQSPAEFREDVSRTRALLQDVSGQPVRGYRAASFSIGRDNLWALEVLAETGHEYSSSIYPVRHDHYGMPEASREPFRHRGNGILEIPLSTVSVFGQNLPCAGGGYFRLLPYGYFRWALGRLRRSGTPAMFYFHPWEIDPEQPRVEGLNARTRFRHYTNLATMQARLGRLLRDFAWDRVDQVYLPWMAAADAPRAA